MGSCSSAQPILVTTNCNGYFRGIRGLKEEAVPLILSSDVNKDLEFDQESGDLMLPRKLFVSYSWSCRKDDVRKMAQYLKGQNFDVWLDIERMHGFIYERMAQGISDADVVLVFFCKKYPEKGSNTYKEIEFATLKKKEILLVRLEKDYIPDGAFLFMVGGRLWVDFFNAENLNIDGPKICDQVRELLHLDGFSENGSMAPDDRDEPLSLRLINVPTFDDCYDRLSEEEMIRQGIRVVMTRHDGGFFGVAGGGGIGKSTLVSQVLRNPQNNIFFRRTCNFSIAVWLNCYQWREGFDGHKASEQEFESELLTIGNQLDPSLDRDFFRSLDQLVQHFTSAAGKRRILFVLDNVFHYTILECLRRKCRTIACCVITRDATVLQKRNFLPFVESDDVDNPFVMSQLADARILKIFKDDFKLKDKLSEDQLLQLVKRTCGLPLLVDLIGGMFRSSKNCELRFQELHLTKIGKEEATLTGRGEKTVSELFKTVFESLKASMRENYRSFLLFDPVEGVDVEDLAFLWQCSLEDADDRCKQLENLALVRHSRTRNYWKVGNNGRDEIDQYLTHQILHETATAICLNEQGEKSADLSSLRLKIISDSQTVLSSDLARKIIRFVHSVLVKRGGKLLFKIASGLDPKTLKPLQSTPSYFDQIEKEFPVDAEGNSALMIAAQAGHVNLAQLLLADCADRDTAIWQQNNFGWTALMFAAQNGHLELVKVLCEKGGHQAILTPNRYESTCTMYAAEKGHLEVVKFLCAKEPKSVTSINKLGTTPLLFAAKTGQLAVVQFLYGQDKSTIHAKRIEGLTALMLAARSGYLPVVKFICEVDKSQVSMENHFGWSALMFAAENGHVDVVQFLCEKEVDVLNSKYGTLLSQYAAKNGHFEVVKFLSEKGLIVTSGPPLPNKLPERKKLYVSYCGHYRFADCINLVEQLSHQGFEVSNFMSRMGAEFSVQLSAIDDADLVVALISKSYQDDKNFDELKFAVSGQKKILLVRLQDGYVPDDSFKKLIGNRPCIDFLSKTGDDDLKAKAQEICREIRFLLHMRVQNEQDFS